MKHYLAAVIDTVRHGQKDGAIDFVEGFQVKLYQHASQGTYSLDILFRDQKVSCTMEDLQQFCRQ